MSTVVKLKDVGVLPIKTRCSMCDNVELIYNTLEENIHIRICSLCYGDIPEHIPLAQDSQYIIQFLRKKNDTEKGHTKRNS